MPEKPSNSKPSTYTLGKTISLVTEFGLIIAVPLVVFAFLGKWVDAKTHQHNTFVLLGMFVALVSSVSLITRRINSIRKELASKNE